MSSPTPFYLEGPAVVSFSGGRTSGYMLYRVLDEHGGTLPSDAHVCFADTGREREETYEFIQECADRWNVAITWLAYGYPPSSHRRNFGEEQTPFDLLIARKKYLPNPVMRFCTQDLKIRAARDFMRAKGFDHWINVVGLRADEPHGAARPPSSHRGGPGGEVVPLQ